MPRHRLGQIQADHLGVGSLQQPAAGKPPQHPAAHLRDDGRERLVSGLARVTTYLAFRDTLKHPSRTQQWQWTWRFSDAQNR